MSQEWDNSRFTWKEDKIHFTTRVEINSGYYDQVDFYEFPLIALKEVKLLFGEQYKSMANQNRDQHGSIHAQLASHVTHRPWSFLFIFFIQCTIHQSMNFQGG